MVLWHSLFIYCRRVWIGVVIAYVLISLTLGGHRSAKPAFYLLAGGWCAAALSWQVFRQVRERRGLSPPAGTSPAARLSLGAIEPVAGYLTLLLALVEFVFSAASPISPADQAALDAHRLVPGHDYGGGLRGNRLGYPGPDFCREKRRGVDRIAALGNSFAIGPTVPFADNYLTRLEAILPDAEVYNFGMSGAGLRDYLAILRADVWECDPDLVLVSLLVSHDLTEFLPRPRYLDPRQHAIFLRLAGKSQLEPEAASGRSPPDRLARPALTEEVFHEVQSHRLDVFLRPAPPSLDKKWQRAAADLDALLAECRRRHVPLAVVLIPDECQINEAALDAALEIANLDRSAVDLDLPQRRLLHFCSERGIPCLDLRLAFAGVPDAYTPRDTHWNVKGNRLAAEAISTWQVIRSAMLTP